MIIDSDGHNTLLTEMADIASGRAWPGAYARVTRNRFSDDWLGREGALRARRREVLARAQQALAAGEPDYGILHAGQTAGLIDVVEPTTSVVARLVTEAEALLRQRTATFRPDG